jgi:hypothetical protein
MPSRAIEESHLLQARSHVAAATARIADQCLIIGRLRARGLDTGRAETCLRTMQNTLNAMRGHKEVIEGMVARMPVDPPSPRAHRSGSLPVSSRGHGG